jgi:hypothetical protein
VDVGFVRGLAKAIAPRYSLVLLREDGTGKLWRARSWAAPQDLGGLGTSGGVSEMLGRLDARRTLMIGLRCKSSIGGGTGAGLLG